VKGLTSSKTKNDAIMLITIGPKPASPAETTNASRKNS
jgi:hypothetical protein